MISFKNVCYSYGTKNIIKDFSLDVATGSVLCLTGKSGSGKTTLLKLAAGILKAESGTVIAPQKISYVFQEDRLLPHISVMQNLLFVAGKEKAGICNDLLEKSGLAQFSNVMPEKLSGGEKRRVAILRAVAYSGDALLLDEPFNGLDLENKLNMVKIIKENFVLKNKPVLMVSHNFEDASLLNAQTVEVIRKL